MNELGFDESDSVVTVLGCEAPHSCLYSDNTDDPEDAEKLLYILSVGLTNIATNNAIFVSGMALLLGPTHANVLARSGHTRESIQKDCEPTDHQKQRLSYVIPGKLVDDPDGKYPAFKAPGIFYIMVVSVWVVFDGDANWGCGSSKLCRQHES